MYNNDYPLKGSSMNSSEFLRSTKIVATVGTATDDVLKLKSLILINIKHLIIPNLQ